MNNERLVQSLIRFGVILGTALVGAAVANLDVILNAFDDPLIRELVKAALIALFSAIGKWFGGVTVAASGLASASPDAAAVQRPNPLSV